MTTHLTTIITALKHLLQTGEVSTQEEIRHSLAAQGILVNQSKISRLLRKIGAVKTVNDQGEIIYSLGSTPPTPSTSSSLAHLILDISANEVMIVIHTTPGSASIIAHLLDRHYATLNILGTVAGDDTLFVVPKSTLIIPQILQAIKDLMNSG